MIEPILAFLQMQIEGAIGDAIELLKPALGKAPEALYSIDVMLATSELILTMIDPEVLCIADINQAVITAPAVRVDDRFSGHATADNGLQSGLLAVGHNLRVDTAVTFEDAEDNCFATSSTTALASDAPSAKVRFINLDFARGEGRGALTFFGNTFSDFKKDRGHAAARKSRQLGRVTGRQIKRKVAQELAEFTLRNFRPPVIAV